MFDSVKQPFSFTMVNETSVETFLFDFLGNMIFVDILLMEYLEGFQKLVDMRLQDKNN